MPPPACVASSTGGWVIVMAAGDSISWLVNSEAASASSKVTPSLRGGKLFAAPEPPPPLAWPPRMLNIQPVRSSC